MWSQERQSTFNLIFYTIFYFVKLYDVRICVDLISVCIVPMLLLYCVLISSTCHISYYYFHSRFYRKEINPTGWFNERG